MESRKFSIPLLFNAPNEVAVQ